MGFCSPKALEKSHTQNRLGPELLAHHFFQGNYITRRGTPGLEMASRRRLLGPGGAGVGVGQRMEAPTVKLAPC